MKSRSRYHQHKALWGYLFILPVVVLFLLFRVYPTFEGLRMSFYRVRGLRENFAGMDNFRDLFASEAVAPVFMRSVANTLGYVVLSVPVIMIASIVIGAVIYNKGRRVTAFYSFVFHVPSIASSVVMAMIWGIIFEYNGILNFILSKAGLPALTYFADKNMAFGLITMTIVFWSLGRPVLLYAIALGGIPEYYYESATIEGASWWQRHWYVTLPLTKPTLLLILVTTTLQGFETFAPVKLLTGGGPDYSTTSMVFELYHAGFEVMVLGRAAAIGSVLFALVAVIAVLQFGLMRSDVEY